MGKTFLGVEEFPFLQPLVEQWRNIRAEYLLVRDKTEAWMERDIHNGRWKTYGLRFKGEDLPNNCHLTTSIIKQIPNVWIAGFSIMEPGAKIFEHVGYTGDVWRSHLGLYCPEDAGIRVAGEDYSWKEGELVVFDDTQPHSAWNDSSEERVVFLARLQEGVMEDFIDFPDFVSEQELAQVKADVLSMRRRWTPIYPSEQVLGPVQDLLEKLSEANLGFYMLGNSVYLLHCCGKGAADVNESTKNKLLERFAWLHERICAKITEVTGKPTVLHGITAPGFHISTVPIDMQPAQYHEDTSIQRYQSGVEKETIYSALLLIDEPSTGASLEYMTPNGVVKHKRYTKGALHFFRGTIPHRISQFKTGLGEYRMTLQCHFYYDSEMGCNRVYF